MKGTEKQIKWAEDIINGVWETLRRAEKVARTDEEKECIVRQIKTFEDNLAKTEAAGWTASDWIEKRRRFDRQALLAKILRDNFKWGYNWQAELWKRENGKENF